MCTADCYDRDYNKAYCENSAPNCEGAKWIDNWGCCGDDYNEVPYQISGVWKCKVSGGSDMYCFPRTCWGCTSCTTPFGARCTDDYIRDVYCTYSLRARECVDNYKCFPSCYNRDYNKAYCENSAPNCEGAKWIGGTCCGDDYNEWPLGDTCQYLSGTYKMRLYVVDPNDITKIVKGCGGYSNRLECTNTYQCSIGGTHYTQAETYTSNTLLSESNWASFSCNLQPKGFLDAADCNSFRGWTCDPDNYAAAIDVHFYKDGPAGSGTFVGKTTANQQREQAVGDQCGGNVNHGFTFATPDSIKDGVSHTIYAYAINTPAGSNPQLSGSPKTLSCAICNTGEFLYSRICKEYTENDWRQISASVGHCCEGATNKVYDESGNSNTGTLINGPTWVSGKFGSGVSFTATNHKISTSTISILNTDTHTIEFWIKFTQNPPAEWRQIMAYRPAGTDRSPGIWTNPSAACIHWRYDPGNTGAGCAGPSGENTYFTIGTWYHIVGIKSGSSFNFYVNGILAETVSVANPKTAGDAAFEIGQTAYNSGIFDIDEVRIYNRALTGAEVRDIYSDPTKKLSGSVAIYHFENHFACQPSDTDKTCCPDNNCVYNGVCYKEGNVIDVDGDGIKENCTAGSNGIWTELPSFNPNDVPQFSSFNFSGNKNYFNVFWEVKYPDNSNKQLKIQCILNCNATKEDCQCDIASGTCQYERWPGLKAQLCKPYPYSQYPGTGGCSVSGPSYNYTAPNEIICRVYNPTKCTDVVEDDCDYQSWI